MINMKEIFKYDRIADQECELAPLTASEQKSSLLESGDLLFARQSLTYEGAGRCVLVLPSVNDRTWESHLIRVRLDKAKASPDFYYYYFRSPTGRKTIESIIQQVAAAGIRGSDLSKLEVPTPPLSRQKAIAEVLTALDDKIAANTKLAETAARMATTLFDLAASSPTTERPLAEVVSTQYGLTTSAHLEPGPKFLRVTDINKQPWITWNTTPNCSVSDSDLVKYRVREGDILVARMADPGKAAYVDAGDPEAVFASYLVRLTANEKTQSLFIYYFLRSDRYLAYAEGAMQGSVQMNMNAKVIVGTDIGLPDAATINSFNEKVRPLRQLIQATLQESRGLVAMRDTLLPQLMSGKLRVRDAEKTVEAVV